MSRGVLAAFLCGALLLVASCLNPMQLRSYSEQDVFLRLCLPVINEGFKILEGGKLMFPI